MEKRLTQKGISYWYTSRKAFALLNKKERKLAKLLVLAIVLAGLLDAIALASVMPAVSMIVDPGLIQKYQSIEVIKNLLQDVTQREFLLIATIFAFIVIALSSVANFLVLLMSSRFGAAIQTRMAYELMQKALNAPYVWFLSKNNASLVRLFHSDIVRWGRDFITRVLTIGQHVIGIVIPLILLIAIAPQTGIFSILIVAIAGSLLTRVVHPRIKSAASESKHATDKLVVIANNALAGAKDIKIACQEGEFSRSFSKVFGFASRASASLSIWQVVPSSILATIGQFALLSLATFLWLSGLPKGEIAGQMALVILVTSRVVPSANRFFGLYSSMWNMLPWVEEVVRVNEELDKERNENREDREIVDLENWKKIELKGISFKYPDTSKNTIDSISLSIQRGKEYGVVGSSGAGKSTLIDIIIGLLTPESGNIEIDGTNMKNIEPREWRYRIGYVPQSPYIIDATIKENVALGVPEEQVDEIKVWEAIEKANLKEFINTLPNGIEERVGDRGIRMSGGQRQRLAIARAFYQDPIILILDEATSSLDSISEREVQETVRALRGMITVVIIAHRLSTIQQCDKIIMLKKGRILVEGTYNDLLERNEEFKELAGALNS